MKFFWKTLLIFSAGLVLFPSAVKFAHVFLEHEHVFCTEYADSHFHEVKVDCELIKFQTSSFSYVQLASLTPFSEQVRVQKSHLPYHFLSTGRKFSFSLRAPPSLPEMT